MESQKLDLPSSLGKYGLSAQEIAEFVADEFPVDYAFVTGSVLEGRAGPTSDLDVRAVCCPSDQHPAIDRSFSRADLAWCGTTRMTTLSGRPIHVIYWPSDVIASFLDRLTAPWSSDSALPIFSAEIWEFREELEVSAALINSSRYAEDRRRAQSDASQVMRMQALLAAFDQASGETEGPLASGDITLAAVRSLTAVNAAVDCFLHSRGHRVTKGKWRLRELRNLDGTEGDVYGSFLAFNLDGIVGDESTMVAEIRRRLAWCNSLLLPIALGS
ncbi:hypothetical protein ABS642_07600 [Microbacterium sp. A8/3-1]|uniref:Polymerase nucleotidyl transferase domain-containing protein n=1 Tax=Microbacterium sp. A8/3-1 TaxID=3160749 RepID=A0AAU7W2G6_9MICO